MNDEQKIAFLAGYLSAIPEFAEKLVSELVELATAILDLLNCVPED